MLRPGVAALLPSRPSSLFQRAALLLAAALVLGSGSGCAVRSDVVRDEELRADGLWSDADQRARRLLLAAGRPDAPVRLVPFHRRLVDELEVGGKRIPIPRLTSTLGIDLSLLFGLHYEASFHFLPTQNAVILLHRDEPPTILPLDPERPIGDEGQANDTPEEAVLQALDRLDADLERVPPPPDPQPEPQPLVEP